MLIAGPEMLLAAWSIEKFYHPLVLFGFAGQFIFMLRFVVQWFASERRGRSYVPLPFWWISCLGGLMLMTYGILDEDPVVMLGQGLGLTIYIRNLLLIYRRRWRLRQRFGDKPARLLGEGVEEETSVSQTEH